MNHAIFAGRLGGDAVLKYTAAGTAVAEFSLAVEERRNDEKVTTWIACAVWAERGERLAPYLTKGSAVTVAGPVSTHAWKDRESGEARSKLHLTVREVTLQGGGQPREQTGVPPAASGWPTAGRQNNLEPRAVADQADGGFNDDIPF